jgi:RNA polymerase sigma-70 factor (ECF subfamily)
MRSSEDTVIRMLREGNNKGYRYLYDHYYALLCAIACEYLNDEYLAESLVDELIIHIWEKRETLDISVSLRSYLIRAVRNRCINYLRLWHEKKEVSFTSTNAQDNAQIGNMTSYDYPLASLLEYELEDKIRQAIELLPDDSRKIFKKSRFEHKDYEQIACELDISVNTVKYHIKQALSMLRKRLSDYL